MVKDDDEKILTALLSGEAELDAIHPEQATRLAQLINSHASNADLDVRPLPEKPSNEQVHDYLKSVLDYVRPANKKPSNRGYDIHGEQRFYSESNNGITFGRFLKSPIDYATQQERDRVHRRLEQALEPFHLSAKAKENIVKTLAQNPISFLSNDGSSFFDFNRKVDTFLTLLNRELKERHETEISRSEYVQEACLTHHNLFCMNPETLLLNLVGKGTVRGQERTGFITLLKEWHGIEIRLGEYVHACLAHPQRFTSNPETAAARIFLPKSIRRGEIMEKVWTPREILPASDILSTRENKDLFQLMSIPPASRNAVTVCGIVELMQPMAERKVDAWLGNTGGEAKELCHAARTIARRTGGGRDALMSIVNEATHHIAPNTALRDGLTPQSTLVPVLNRMNRNLRKAFKNQLKSRILSKSSLWLDRLPQPSSPSEGLELEDLRTAIERGMEFLKPKEQKIATEIMNGKSYAEIARNMDVSRKYISKFVKDKVAAKLRIALKDYDLGRE